MKIEFGYDYKIFLNIPEDEYEDFKELIKKEQERYEKKDEIEFLLQTIRKYFAILFDDYYFARNLKPHKIQRRFAFKFEKFIEFYYQKLYDFYFNQNTNIKSLELLRNQILDYISSRKRRLIAKLEPIFRILKSDSFSHKEKRLLLYPYLSNLYKENICFWELHEIYKNVIYEIRKIEKGNEKKIEDLQNKKFELIDST